MEYTNTTDILGIQGTLDALISDTLTEFTESGLKTIPASSGLSHKKNLKKIRLPNVETIGQYGIAYSGLTAIDAEDLPKLSSCESYCFQNCNIKSAIFPNVFKSSSNNSWNVFSRNPIRAVVFSNESLSSLNGNFFKGTMMTEGQFGFVFVPSSLLETYKTSTGFNTTKLKPLSEYPYTDNNYGNITDDIQTILAAENDGSYLEKYSIGDIKTFDFDGELIECSIIGIDKDDLADGSGKAHITWGSFFVLPETMKYGTDCQGWETSDIRQQLESMYNTLQDSALKNAIKTVNKSWFYNSETKYSADRFFIPSNLETGYSTGIQHKETSGCVYDEFFSNYSKENGFPKKHPWTSSSSGEEWWTRTGIVNNSRYYYTIEGNAGKTRACEETRCVMLCFCT